jgi:uncharacterized lipoprotein NlpE involved in copper resistance
MNRFFFCFCFPVIFFLSDVSAQKKNNGPVEVQKKNAGGQKQKKDVPYKYVTVFKGTLVCGDCPGITTELTFINDILTFKENDTYLGRNVTLQLSGSYTTDRGYKKDDNATVYVLDDDKPGHERRFLRLNDTTLLMLGSDAEIIDTTLYYKLFKKK